MKAQSLKTTQLVRECPFLVTQLVWDSSRISFAESTRQLLWYVPFSRMVWSAPVLGCSVWLKIFFSSSFCLYNLGMEDSISIVNFQVFLKLRCLLPAVNELLYREQCCPPFLSLSAPELPSKKVLFQKELCIAVTNNFVYSVGCLFTKLTGYFTAKRYFIFIKHRMSITDFISWVMGIIVRKYFPMHIYYSVLLQRKNKVALSFCF